MNWDAVGALAELAGAIGVIGSLVYLAVQIRQNSHVVRFTLHENYVAGIRGIFEQVQTNPELYRVWRRAMQSPDEMTEDDREHFGMLCFAFFNRIHLGYLAREVDSFMGEKYLSDIDQAFLMPATRSWWTRQRGAFDPGFAAVVDERLALARTEESP